MTEYLAHRPGRGIVRDTWTNADGGETAEERAERRARGIIVSADLSAQRQAKANAPTPPTKPGTAIVSRTGGPREVVYGTPEALDRSGECPVPD